MFGKYSHRSKKETKLISKYDFMCLIVHYIGKIFITNMNN